jgi:FMN reductase
MNVLIISCSLSPGSRSRVLAAEATRRLKSLGAHVEFIDLLHHRDLPFCDGEDVDECVVEPLAKPVREADAIILAAPVYNFDVNAAAKNLVELTGSAWEGKIVGFLCAAGGRSSYMSVMNLANSLMLDFRCLIVPRFVYATGNDFAADQISSTKVRDRLDVLCREIVRLAGALRGSASTTAAP